MPPSNSYRKTLLIAIESILKTATGEPDYFNNYSNVVAISRDTLQSRLEEPKKIAVRIRDGAAKHERRGANLLPISCTLDVLVELTVRSTTLVKSMSDVIADMVLVMERNCDIKAARAFVEVDNIEEPFYDFAQEYGITVMHLRAKYEYEPGTTR